MNDERLFSLLKADLGRFSNTDLSKNYSALRLWIKLFHPRFAPVFLLRFSRFFNRYILTKPFAFIASFTNVVFFGLEVTPKCKIGGGLFLPHTVGTVIGASEIGENVTIFQGVTIGAKFADMNYDLSLRPSIGNNVVIGAGAKIFGSIKVGNNAIIAANSLVTETVEDGSFMIGVPAVKRIRDDKQ